MFLLGFYLAKATYNAVLNHSCFAKNFVYFQIFNFLSFQKEKVFETGDNCSASSSVLSDKDPNVVSPSVRPKKQRQVKSGHTDPWVDISL